MTHSVALRLALADAARVALCPACAEPENQGLCHSEHCQRAVLPQLKPNALNLAAHSGRFGESADSLTEIAERVKKVERPKRAAAMRRQLAAHIKKLPPEKRGAVRLAFAVAGLNFRSRSA